jgi:hypothetical protein
VSPQPLLAFLSYLEFVACKVMSLKPIAGLRSTLEVLNLCHSCNVEADNMQAAISNLGALKQLRLAFIKRTSLGFLS